MAENEPKREVEPQAVDVTKEFLEKTDSEFHEFLILNKAGHLKIDVDISNIVADAARLNSLKHLLTADETRKLVVRATQEEADHFRTLFPPGAVWQIITRE